MKTRSIVLALALCVVGVAASLAENPNMGTWKLNEAKSKIATGMMKNTCGRFRIFDTRRATEKMRLTAHHANSLPQSQRLRGFGATCPTSQRLPFLLCQIQFHCRPSGSHPSISSC